MVNQLIFDYFRARKLAMSHNHVHRCNALGLIRIDEELRTRPRHSMWHKATVVTAANYDATLILIQRKTNEYQLAYNKIADLTIIPCACQ